jgi:hypothetical protein
LLEDFALALEAFRLALDGLRVDDALARFAAGFRRAPPDFEPFELDPPAFAAMRNLLVGDRLGGTYLMGRGRRKERRLERGRKVGFGVRAKRPRDGPPPRPSASPTGLARG